MADDFFGPASDGAVSTRPALTPQLPLVGSPPSWFAPCSSEDAEDGTQISAEWLNRLVGNLEAVRLAGGIDSGDVAPGSDGVLLGAILSLIGAAIPTHFFHFGVGGGAADAIVAEVSPAASGWVDGHVYLVRPSATSTTSTPTFKPAADLPPKIIVHADGSALAAGEIVANRLVLFGYDATLDKVVMLGGSQVQPYACGLLSATSIPTSVTTNLTIGAPAASAGITLVGNRLLLPTAGRYLVTASSAITGVFTNGLITAARRSSVDALIDTSVFGAFGQDGSGTWGNCAGVYRVSAGDRVAFSLIQYSGGATTTAGVGAYSVTRIGD